MIKTKQAKSKDIQYKYDQYYYIKYSLSFRFSPTKKYVSVVKARSASLAKEIVKLKLSRDYKDSNCKIHSVRMFSQQSSFQRRRLSMSDWQNIRTCAFPNISDHLFKYQY
ncbi:hypothetical protein EB151_09415 [archaeon]|nr:hypothetical protein [archaeon]